MTETIKVKPWGADQGDFVLINAEDFDDAKHELFGETEQVEGKPKRTKKADAATGGE